MRSKQLWERTQTRRRYGLFQFFGLVAAVACMISPFAVHAQLNTATLQGVAKDVSGAVVPNATVTIRNKETGVAKTVFSGSQGEFFLPSIQPGLYDITVSHEGFQTAKQSGYKLEVGQQAQLDLLLSAGNVNEVVTVDAAQSEIPTSDTTLGTVIEQKQVVDLPLNGRQFSQLIQLAPGVVPIDNSQNAGKAPNFGAGAASPSVNGQTNRSNLFFLDGMIDSNPFFGGFRSPRPLTIFRNSRRPRTPTRLSLARQQERS